jgi:hypothetical protein
MMQAQLIFKDRSGSSRRAGTRFFWFVLSAPFALWGGCALYYGSWPHAVCVALTLLYGVAHLTVVWIAPWRRVILGCMALFLLPLSAFHLMRPSNNRPWQPDVAQQAYAQINGDQVTVYNVRNCVYQSETNFTVGYETRHYDLSKVRSADIFLVDWGLRKVAHAMLSFGFEDGQYLCFSIETRKEIGEAYSAFKGLFRQYEIIFVAGDERDLVGLRTNFREGETARLYRLVHAPKNAVRAAFLDYLAQLNALKQKPQWYNAMTGNCMVGFFQIARHHAIKGRGRWHWSVILNGYADEHAYTCGALDTSLPFETLREQSIINSKARAAGISTEFSALIRQGIPGIKPKPTGAE